MGACDDDTVGAVDGIEVRCTLGLAVGLAEVGLKLGLSDGDVLPLDVGFEVG